ncbi:MAG: DUF6226 family protein [Acidimicrobiales bacterium]
MRIHGSPTRQSGGSSALGPTPGSRRSARWGWPQSERNASIDWSEPPSTVVTRADCALPVVAGGLPLVLARSRIESVDDAGVTIGVGSPAVVHRWIPDCGCDACDSGSQGALDELDEQVLAVVTGRFRRLRREDRTITVVSGQICQSAGLSGLTDPTTVLADPTGWEELDGPSWLETSERDANSPF